MKSLVNQLERISFRSRGRSVIKSSPSSHTDRSRPVRKMSSPIAFSSQIWTNFKSYRVGFRHSHRVIWWHNASSIVVYNIAGQPFLAIQQRWPVVVWLWKGKKAGKEWESKSISRTIFLEFLVDIKKGLPLLAITISRWPAKPKPVLIIASGSLPSW